MFEEYLKWCEEKGYDPKDADHLKEFCNLIARA